MASTIQEALANAGVITGGKGKSTKATKATKSQTLAPAPELRSVNVPKWLTREGVQDGTVRSFINPLFWNTHQVFMLHASGKSYVEVTAIVKDEQDERFAYVTLAGEDEPRKFRLGAEVRYVLVAL